MPVVGVGVAPGSVCRGVVDGGVKKPGSTSAILKERYKFVCDWICHLQFYANVTKFIKFCAKFCILSMYRCFPLKNVQYFEVSLHVPQ